ncbi:MAG: tRNA-dihydrouridine synthase family protein [Phycisphaeraceae bacterium]|nr:tRNA-dihydrouridine synthase family protein [Phycisphaerae bacterium]MBX3393508.1 tRNA-dihydrouridine synthase family protein [Phycisphaeraceae bacterium]
MSCQTNNATAPSPAVAPGRERIDPRRVVEWLVNRHGPVATDPRLAQVAPGFDAPFFQAGLAGYSDAAMRIVARRHGCPFCVTEALLDRTLLAGGRGFTKADLGELHDNIPGGPEDHPLAGQIMGSHPLEMAAGALKMAEQGIRGDRAYRAIAYDHDPELWADVIESHLRNPGGEQVRVEDDARSGVGRGVDPGDIDGVSSGGGVDGEGSWPGLAAGDGPAAAGAGASFQVIDVNLACPVKKIKNKARGGHWLTDPAGAIRILEAVRDAVPSHIPCSVKLRRAYDDTPEMADHFERIFDAAYRIGYCWATVHARTVEQKYIGPSRWTFLRDLVARHPDRIVFGSGDVWDVNDIFAMIGYTGVQAVSVARGCIGNPWIFRQARDMIAGRPPRPPTMAQQRVALEEHFRLSLAVTRKFKKAEEQSSKMMRKFAIRFAAHHPRSQAVRDRMIAVRNAAEWLGVLDEHYPAEDAASSGR